MHNHYPVTFPRAKEITVTVNGASYDILETGAAYFVPAEYETNATVHICINRSVKKVQISPKRFNIPFSISQDTVTIQLTKNMNLYLDIAPLEKPIFFYGNLPEKYDGKADFYFESGQIYEVGEIKLESNQSVYIAAGAVVKGRIVSKNASGIKIYGLGILDNSYYSYFNAKKQSIYISGCENVTVQGIIIINPTAWTTVFHGCTEVLVDNIKEIGEVVCSDGIDIVGSNNVTVQNCILRNNDDCVVIKHKNLDTDDDCLKDIFAITVRDCILFNSEAGNAIEIGHELCCEEVKDIVFENIDIIRVDGIGAPISIHAGDRATVKDIIYRNIFIEHYYDKLLDIRVMKSVFNHDEMRGQIRNITFENIFVNKEPCNYGYSVSVIGGYDDAHTVEHISFINFKLNDEVVKNENELDLFTKNAKHISFRKD